MKVAVLMGGRSAEREVSLSTGRGIAEALRKLGHEVTSLDAADGMVLPAGEEQSAARSALEVHALPQAAAIRPKVESSAAAQATPLHSAATP